MNKLFTKIATAFVGIAMAVGVGVAVGSHSDVRRADAAEVVYKEVTFLATNHTTSTNSYTGTAVFNVDGFILNCQKFNTSNSSWNVIKCGQKSATGVANIITAAAIDKAITKVTVTFDSIKASAYNSITLYTSSDGSSWTSAGTFTKSSGAQSVTISSPAASKYYKVAFDYKASSNGSAVVSKIQYYVTEAASASVSIDTPDLPKLPAGYVASSKLHATASDFSGTVTYSWQATTNSSYVTVAQDPTDGSKCTVTSKGTNDTGNVTIKVTASNGVDSDEDTITITLVSPNTVAQSIAVINAGSGTEGVLTKGIVNGYYKTGSGYTSDISEAAAIDGSGRAKFFISADGTEGTDSTRMEAYNCYDVNGDAFSSLPALGVEVVIYGDLAKYNSTYEVNQNGFLVYKAVPTVSSIAKTSDLTKDTYTVGEKFSLDGLVITATLSNGSTMDVTSLCDFAPDDGDDLEEELTELMISYSASNTPTTTSGSDIDITITISVTYPSPDETIALISAIGTVEYTQTSYDKIAAARASYNGLPAQSKENVNNYSTLTAAESSFASLKSSAVTNVETLITNIGTVTLSSGTAITNAETAYAALLAGDLGKSLVSNYSTLTAARTTYDGLVADRDAADSVETLIDALPAASSITDYSHHTEIAAAKAAYDALSVSAKGMVNETKAQKLADCVAADAEYAPSVLGTYNKVTSLSQLTNGANVIITNADGTVAMGEQKSNNRGTATGAASANSSITISSDSTDIQVFTIESYTTQQNTIVAFKTLNSLADVSGYLYAAASGNNYLRTQASVDANAKFYVTLSSGNFTVSADESSNRHIMKYNSTSDLFSCYSSNQQAVAIYVKGGASTFTVTYDGNGSDGGTTPVDANSPYNASATVTTLENTFTRTGYTFSSWNTAPDGSGSSYDEGAQFTISANTILYAIWEQGGGGGSATAARCYHLVESTDDLVAGAKYIIASTSTIASHAMSTTQNSNNRGEETVTISNSIAAISSDGVQVVTLGGSTGAWTFAVSGGYLYAASSTANHLKTESEVDANGTWAISVSDGIASIVAQGSNSRNVMQYNSGSSLFACYASASQTGVSLYRLDFGETLLHNITCSGSGSYTIAEGYAWSDLKSVYQDLPSAEQTSLKTASNAGLVRYDYLVGKYGTSTFENFIGRTVTPIGHSSVILLTALGNKSTNTSIIVIVTVGIAAIAIGGYFLLRKKKED